MYSLSTGALCLRITSRRSRTYVLVSLSVSLDLGSTSRHALEISRRSRGSRPSSSIWLTLRCAHTETHSMYSYLPYWISYGIPKDYPCTGGMLWCLLRATRTRGYTYRETQSPYLRIHRYLHLCTLSYRTTGTTSTSS